MSDTADIKESQITMLNNAGIPYRYIHVTDDGPVILVDEPTIRMIAQERSSGKVIEGRYVCQRDRDSKKWMASFIDGDGSAQFYTDVPEAVAYKLVLGYSAGRHRGDSRYRGYCPLYHTKKKR